MTVADFNIRIQKIIQKISELGNKYANDLKWGSKNTLEDRNKLLYLEGVLELLKDIDIYDEDANCIDDDKIKELFATITEKYDLCFPPENSLQDYFRITEDGDIRELENNTDLRIIE